jgi:uncharacterized protein YbcV (DUF1398 family)
MDPKTSHAIEECALQSDASKLSFAAAIARLTERGVERYHADYSRRDRTYYMPDGETLVVPVDQPLERIAENFAPEEIEAALSRIRRGEIIYPEFAKLTQAAGVVGYFAHVTGRQVVYLGRKGEQHVVRMPAVPAK